jgi:PAS domain S-box-containing protein
MNLRTKLLFGIGIALIVTFTLVALFSYLSMEQSYRMLERQEVHRALESTTRTFESDIRYTDSINRDSAGSLETYRFAEGQNPDWVEQNVENDYFLRFDLDYVLVFNRSNQFVFGKGYNSSSLMFETVPDTLVSDIRNRNVVEDIYNSTTGTYGFFNSQDGLFIITSHPVADDNLKGPVSGSLHVVRRIDRQYLADLAARAGYSVTVVPSQEITTNPSLAAVVSRITPVSPVVIEPENDDTISGYIHVNDLRNPEGYYVKVTQHRTIYQTGQDTIFVFLVSLFVAGIFIILFVLLFIDRVVLSRLNAIISTVRENKETGNNNGAHDATREDELARLALEIDPVFSELAWSRTELKESEERYRTLIDQLPDYVIVHRNGIILYVNPAAASHLGYDASTLTGQPVLPFIAPEYHDIVKRAIAQRMAGEEFPSYEMKIIAHDRTTHTVFVNGAVINYEGKPASLNVLTDISRIKMADETIRSANEMLEKRVVERTEELIKANEQLISEIAARTRAEHEITRSLEEKDLLLREIHHRVKNNLQIIASLLNLQSRYISDPNVLECIRDSQSRVRAMALVHERIYRSHNIAEINLKDYLIYLTKQIISFYNSQSKVAITVNMDDIMADIDTVIPVGLIMNELVSNSLKHAFSKGPKGTISITCILKDATTLHCVYHDNGSGMPTGLDWKNTESLGLRLVNNLVDQLNGTIDLGTGEGTAFIMELQMHMPEKPGDGYKTSP